MASGDKQKQGTGSNFLVSSIDELKKVTWPTRNQAVRLTLLVLGFCFASAIIIGIVDFVLNTGYQSLIDLAPQQSTANTEETTPIGNVSVTTQQTKSSQQTQQKNTSTQQNQAANSNTQQTPSGSSQQHK